MKRGRYGAVRRHIDGAVLRCTAPSVRRCTAPHRRRRIDRAVSPCAVKEVSMAHKTRYHVYPTDCDVFGHVNHATMITMLEHARWALLETVTSFDALRRGEVWSVVRHVDVS